MVCARLRLICGVALTWTVATSSAAQAGGAAAREDCKAIAAGLPLIRADEDGYGRGLARLMRCPQEGPEIVALLWHDRDVSLTMLSHLAGVSERLLDQRILDAVLAVLQDKGRLPVQRQAALRGAVAYLYPRLVISIPPPTRMHDGTIVGRVLIGELPGPVHLGARPPSSSSAERVLTALENLTATEEQDQQMRDIAKALLLRLAPRLEGTLR